MARHYMKELLSACVHFHANGVAHRDIKPENIMLSQNYRIKICDFGEAKKFNVDAIIELVTQLK